MGIQSQIVIKSSEKVIDQKGNQNYFSTCYEQNAFGNNKVVKVLLQVGRRRN